MSLAVDDLVAAPIGVSLLDRLEHEQRADVSPFRALHDSSPVAMRRAQERVRTMQWAELLAIVLDAAQIVGPWRPGAAESLAFAYVLADARSPIAEIVCERFGERFDAPVDLSRQECWLSDASEREYWLEAAFTDFSRVYGNGEFTWDGFWTVTAPPAPVHDQLIDAWEMFPGPITRWALPVSPGVRPWPIKRPMDWVQLVEAYPKVASRPHSGWELPGPNQHLENTARLLEVDSQNALRTVISRHVLPDWAAVARDFDGVHLTWGGFLTSEGYVSDLPSGGVTMLRYWHSERTLWMRDVFGQAEPLSAPRLSGRMSGVTGVDASRGDDVRSRQDRVLMSRRLGR